MIAVGPEGTLFVADGNTEVAPRIWRLDPDGRARIHAGLPVSGCRHLGTVDARPAVGETTLNGVNAMAVGADGTLYYADNDSQSYYTGTTCSGSTSTRNYPSIRRVAAPLPTPAYDAGSGVVFTIASRDGSELYGFDKYGHHKETRDARTGSLARTFDYDSSGRVTYVRDYDDPANLTTSGKYTQLTYNSTSVDIVGPYGHTTQMTLDSTTKYANSILDPIAIADASDYGYRIETDSGGLITKITDARDQVHLFQYDSYGRLTRDANPSAGVKTLVPTWSAGQTTTTQVTTADGRVSTFVVQPLNGGQKRTMTDPAGLVSTWERLPGYANRETRADGSTLEWTEAVDPRLAMQAPITTTSTEKLTVTTGTDLTNVRTQSSTASCAASACAGTPYATCGPTNLLQLRERTDTRVVNSHSYTTYYNSCGTGSVPTETMTTPVGRTRTVTFDAQGRPKTVAVPGINTVTMNYDSSGRLSEVRQGSGGLERVLSRSYYSASSTGGSGERKGQPQDVSINFGTPITTTFATYDAMAQPLTVTLPGTSRTLTMSYDYNGNLSSLDPPGSTATSHAFGYEGTDRPASYTPPAVSGTNMPTQKVYNRDGQVSTLLRPDGDNVTYGYDSAGRPSSVSHALRSLSYGYDTVGRLATISTSDGQNLTNTFTQTGALLRSVKWTGTIGGTSGLTASFGYNNDFRIATEDAGDVRAEYGYDNDGLISTVTVKSWNGSSWSTMTNGTFNVTRDPSSNMNGLISATSVGSVSDTRTFNGFGELDHYKAWDGSTTYVEYDLDATNYERDKLGRIVRRAETSPTSRTWDYTYHVAGWLTGVTEGGATKEAYTYDANGNRSTATNNLFTASSIPSGSTTIDAQDRLVTYPASGTNKTFTYKKNGDRLTRADASGTTTYTYDAFGNLVTVALPGSNTITYVIDGLGRRVGKKVNGTLKQQWIYGNQLRPILELDGSGNYKARFIYATHVNVPDIIVSYTGTGPGTPSTVYRVITDHLGSVRAIVSAAGGSAGWTFDYDAFGNVLSNSPSYPAVTGTPDPMQTFAFAGGMYDPHSKLVRFGARDYEPETGRWVQKDPLGFRAGDLNLSSYAFGDPISHQDPDGKQVAEICEEIGQGLPPQYKWIALGIGLIAAAASTLSSPMPRVGPMCPPCPPPRPPRHDTSHSHYPCMDHCHYFEMNQNPFTCKRYEKQKSDVVCVEPGQSCP
jgi:RHS repeat-associated protein